MAAPYVDVRATIEVMNAKSAAYQRGMPIHFQVRRPSQAEALTAHAASPRKQDLQRDVGVKLHESVCYAVAY